MKTLDRYLFKQLLIPIIFCTFTLIFLVFVADLFDKLDDMLKNKADMIHILQYYILITPQTFASIISWASLLATMFVLSNLNFHNEITAMKVCGLEITSIIRPILFVGLGIGVIAFIVNDKIVPTTSRLATSILEKEIEKKESANQREIFSNVTYFGGGNRLYFARSFDPEIKQLSDFIILWLDDHKQVKKKTTAQKAIWTGSEWELHQATDYSVDRSTQMMGEPVFARTAVYPEIQEAPEEFIKAVRESENISYHELKEYIKKMKENGVRLSSEAVDLQYKLAAPWQSFVVILLTIPILAKTATRRTIAMNILICIGVIFLYHVLGAVMLAMGKAGKLFSMVSAWGPTFAFASGAFFFMERAND